MLRDILLFLHNLQCIATLQWMILMVTLAYSMYDMVYFLCQLGAFRLQRCKECMWKLLCILVRIKPFQVCSDMKSLF
jgi:hypothetical protein